MMVFDCSKAVLPNTKSQPHNAICWQIVKLYMTPIWKSFFSMRNSIEKLNNSQIWWNPIVFICIASRIQCGIIYNRLRIVLLTVHSCILVPNCLVGAIIYWRFIGTSEFRLSGNCDTFRANVRLFKQIWGL